MALVLSDLQADFVNIFKGIPKFGDTKEETAEQWAKAIDDYVKDATSDGKPILTPGASAMESGLTLAMDPSGGTPGGFGTKVAAAIDTPYLLLCTFPPDGICINLDDIGGVNFSSCLQAAVLSPTDDPVVPANVIATCIDTFVKAHRGQFPPPPDPNQKPIV